MFERFALKSKRTRARELEEEVYATLREIGLSPYEIEVYQALLSAGSATPVALTGLCKVPRSRIYGVLGTLARKGFASIRTDKPTVYEVISPEVALRTRIETLRREAFERIEETSKKVEKILPTMMKLCEHAHKTEQTRQFARESVHMRIPGLKIFKVGEILRRGKLFVTPLKKAIIALVPTLFFILLAIISPIGYTAQTHVYAIEKHFELMEASGYAFAVVNFNCNVSFNPLLYPISWLSGKGRLSDDLSMIYLPYWTYHYGRAAKDKQYALAPTWGKLKDIEGEATMKLVLEEFLINIPILYAAFFAIELKNSRRLYWSFLSGTAGFVFGDMLGVIGGFFLPVFLAILVFPKLKSARAMLSELSILAIIFP